MIDPNLSYDNIDALAAGAFAKSRTVATALRADVLHNLKPQERTGPKRLLTAIERRRIFDQKFLSEIDALVDQLERMIDDGTTEIERWDASPENVSAPAVWTERRRTQTAEELGHALMVLLDLQEALLAVHDLMHAEQAINELRQDS